MASEALVVDSKRQETVHATLAVKLDKIKIGLFWKRQS